MTENTEDCRCLRCNRRYRAEARDRGLCCVCERDFRLFTRYGPDWRTVVRQRGHGIHEEAGT